MPVTGGSMSAVHRTMAASGAGERKKVKDGREWQEREERGNMKKRVSEWL